MKTETVSIESIRPYERNPRQHGRGVEKIAASIKEFGFRQPIVVDKDGVIVAGHGRYVIEAGGVHIVIAGDNMTAEIAEGDVIKENKPNKSELHPTMKPVRLLERLVKNSSERGGIVLDPFGGSGSTMIACERTGRAARLIELDAAYCDVIVKRWEGVSGKGAERHG